MNLNTGYFRTKKYLFDTVRIENTRTNTNYFEHGNSLSNLEIYSLGNNSYTSHKSAFAYTNTDPYCLIRHCCIHSFHMPLPSNPGVVSYEASHHTVQKITDSHRVQIRMRIDPSHLTTMQIGCRQHNPCPVNTPKQLAYS